MATGWARIIIVGVLLGGTGVEAENRSTVSIRLYEDPAISPEVLNRSRARVDAILTSAGVAVVWHLCASKSATDPVCDAAPEPNEVVIRLVSHVPPISAHACGVALVPRDAAGHFITVYPRCVYESADALRVGADVVLACTLAHEVGHQFLGPQHSAFGLMQAQPPVNDWNRAVQDGLVFSWAESRRLRAALLHRASSR
jgi:hypothetical protein